MKYSVFQSHMPKTVYGGDCLYKLCDIILKCDATNVCLITDRGVKEVGLVDKVAEVIKDAGAKYYIHDGIVSEPSYTDVQLVVDWVSDMNADLIIGVGGGSVMDTAKLCSLCSGGKYSVSDLLTNPLCAEKCITSVMIPSTCGTGSEATGNAIVSVPESDVKIGIVNTAMIPDYVLLDPIMIAKLPKAIIASTGVDALAHAIECYTGKKANPISDAYALYSANLIFSNIEKAYSDDQDYEAKSNMLYGAFYGGAAITSSGTTAVHALSYPLGGKYHIPHGVSNAMLLEHVMEFNADAVEDRLSMICDTIAPQRAEDSKTDRAAFVIRRIKEIVKTVQIPMSLKAYGVKEEDLDFLVDTAAGVTRLLSNNVKTLTKGDIRNIYAKLL